MQSKRPRRIWVALAVLAALTSWPDRTSSAPDNVVIIKEMIEQIKTSASPTKRQDGTEFTEKQFAANTLTYFIMDMDPREREALDPGIIDDIAGLLGDQDIHVRYEAAAALGYIGEPARRAVPALLQALKEARSRTPKVSTGYGVEHAIVFRLREWKVCIPPQPVFDPMLEACDYLLR